MHCLGKCPTCQCPRFGEGVQVSSRRIHGIDARHTVLRVRRACRLSAIFRLGEGR